MALSLVSVNITGLRYANKLLSFLRWLSHLSPSVVCQQETHALSSDELSVWFSRFGYLCLGSFGSSRSCVVTILYHPLLFLIVTPSSIVVLTLFHSYSFVW